jgi:hypothetical protein
MTMWKRSLTLTVLALVAACEQTDRQTAVVRDSAGVTIVTNGRAPGWARPWVLAETPEVVIGVVEGPDAYQFSSIVGAFALPDGRIVVANGRTPPDIRIFDVDGRHMQTLGREGAGPGEFRTIFFTDRLGDTIRAYDPLTARLTRFAPDGSLAGIDPIASVGADPATRFILFPGGPDGGFLARTNAPQAASEQPGRRPGRNPLVLTDRFGQPTAGPLDVIDGEFDVTSERAGLLLFTPRASAAAADSVVYVGAATDFSIDVYDADLLLRRRIHWAAEPRPVGPAEIAAHLEERLAAVADPSRRELMARSLEGRPARSHMPAYDRDFVVDDGGHLWVPGFLAPGELERTWTIFDAEGRLQGELRMPSTRRIFSISGDRIFAGDVDELGVQRLNVWRILK